MLRTQSMFVAVIVFILINIDLSVAKIGGRGGSYGESSYGRGSGK